MAGSPDIIGVINSKFIGIEVKKDGHTQPTAIQQYRIDCINRAGGHAFVAYDWKSVRCNLHL